MKAGVIIIGSLFWDKHQGKFTNLREDWRKKRLQFDKRIHVFAPIRYGRNSDSGYTMVFSKEAENENNWGTVYFVPFKKDIKSFKGLNKEAEFLSNAEGGKDVNLVKGNDDKWCVIGILFNPNFDKSKRAKLLKMFQSKLISQGLANVYSNFCVPPEESILTNQAEINIAWPKTVNPKSQKDFDAYDFIIATCPKQKVTNGYPNELSIKNGVLIDERNYFFNNIRNGITTFQDKAVLDLIFTERTSRNT